MSDPHHLSHIEGLKQQIDLTRLPEHVAIIMDGNGRWAQQQGFSRIFGHQNGVQSVREASETAAELGIKYLTLYAFSTENWSRPEAEVNALMMLLVQTIRKEVATLQKNQIRLQAIGDITALPNQCFMELTEAIEQTKHNTRMTLVLALNYSAKWELMRAVKQLAKQVKFGNVDVESIDSALFERYLATQGMPDPELLIRTSGEHRISNFLLWQIAYSELYFTDVFWPDFRKEHLYAAILNYQSRQRRFGKTGEQMG